MSTEQAVSLALEEFDKYKNKWILAMTDKEVLDKIWNSYKKIQQLTLLSSDSPDMYSSSDMKTAKMVLDSAVFIHNENIELSISLAHDKSNEVFLKSGGKFDD